MTEFIRMPREPTANQIQAAGHLLPDLNPGRARRVLHQIYQTFVDMRPDAERPKGLTKKMAQLLETIVEFQEEHGFSPTQEELATLCGQERTTIRDRINALRRRGYLQVKSGYRGIIVLKHG